MNGEPYRVVYFDQQINRHTEYVRCTSFMNAAQWAIDEQCARKILQVSSLYMMDQGEMAGKTIYEYK